MLSPERSGAQFRTQVKRLKTGPSGWEPMSDGRQNSVGTRFVATPSRSTRFVASLPGNPFRRIGPPVLSQPKTRFVALMAANRLIRQAVSGAESMKLKKLNFSDVDNFGLETSANKTRLLSKAVG
jgi:hypothetical protein